MKLATWLGGLKAAPCNRRARRARPARPQVGYLAAAELLEDRTVPAFAAPVHYDVGPAPQAVAAGDFTGDGTPDLVVANTGGATVSVVVGNGDGTFQPAVDSATGYSPLSVAVGDFNGDGNMDVATANAGDVSVLLGNGDGTFAAPTSIGLGSSPQSVAVGDFNGDGTLDLGVTSNVYYGGYYGYYGWYPGYYAGQATVLVGNGDGSFAAPVTSWAGYGFHTGAATGDFNGDGAQDFAAANFDYWTATVFFGDGAGNLSGPSDASAGPYPWAVAAGDLNADGRADLAVADRYAGEVSVLLANDTGWFAPAQGYAAGNQPTAVVLGDFNHDTRPDIATADSAGDGINVLRGRANGTFTPVENFDAGPGAFGLAAGDFNGDGWLDAATADAGGATASVLVNDQSWPPPPPPTVSVNDVTVTEGNTGTTDATFTVSLSYSADTDVTVHYATADGSATAGSDYTATSGDLVIPAGQTAGTVTVPVLGDRLAEPTETFALNLSSPVNATLGDGQGGGTILDDEPRVSVGDATVTEGNTGSVTATFTVFLSAESDVPVTVHYATADATAAAGSDYTAASGDVTIPAGQTSGTFTVAVLGDRLAEPTETYLVNLSAPVNAGIGDGQGAGTILDNEPRISINNVAKKEGNGKTTAFTFTVTLSAVYDQAVTVHYATADGTALAGSDYQAKSGTVTIAAGVRSATITINVTADKLKEAAETFFVNLSAPSSNALIDVSQGIGTILDDDSHGK
jgi:hypothetical protein